MQSPSLPPRLDMTSLSSSTPSHYYSSPTSVIPMQHSSLAYMPGSAHASPTPPQRFTANGNLSSNHKRKGRRKGGGRGSRPVSPNVAVNANAQDSDEEIIIMLRSDASTSNLPSVLATPQNNSNTSTSTTDSSLVGLGFDVDTSHSSSHTEEEEGGPEPGDDWVGSIPLRFARKASAAAASASSKAESGQ